MKFEHVPSQASQAATHLWLMLPGAYMKPADFIRAGFADAVHERGLPHDIALLDATISEVADGSALAFLQEYVRAVPADPRLRVCVLGISLGGQLAMHCAAQATPRIASVLVMAPYLGPRDLLAQVGATGRMAEWAPQPSAVSDTEREIWRWLQGCAVQEPPLYLGYGRDDRFASAHALMAQALPEDRIDTVPGGHDWPVWAQLWNRHLDLCHV
ncbi:MAG: hypothetical protein JWQ13_4497 [Ramlibacter sp.]|nr:hypothetical protein [Ramlibacter sp.]